MNSKVTGKVAKVVNNRKLILNKGSNDGMKKGCEYLVYYNDEEIFDPDTKESLGFLEVSCGIGKIEHIQEKISTLIPARRQKSLQVPNILVMNSTADASLVPFTGLEKKDLCFKEL